MSNKHGSAFNINRYNNNLFRNSSALMTEPRFRNRLLNLDLYNISYVIQLNKCKKKNLEVFFCKKLLKKSVLI
jgi:hypothetical protein